MPIDDETMAKLLGPQSKAMWDEMQYERFHGLKPADREEIANLLDAVLGSVTGAWPNPRDGFEAIEAFRKGPKRS